ncbi:hypothetical protein [Massilia putida]|uniref:hypothetical protein n=1 Tax=Massilia putida TaxID=1141883 RepID=UPI0012EC7359|nr:hypothetical protein [Massilia putida]
MRKRRIRRNFGESAQGLTPEDRKAMQAYRTNRGSRRYYEDLDAINSGETVKPKTNDEPK